MMKRAHRTAHFCISILLTLVVMSLLTFSWFMFGEQT